jgi:hypothetical protein
MSVNGVTGSAQSYENKSIAKSKGHQNNNSSKNVDDTAAVYEKSDHSSETKKNYRTDTATVERLKAEAEKRAQSLRDLVEKMLLKQGKTLTDDSDMYKLLREGKVDVDPETSAQAKKDVAEDGYWGVEQTSDRMVSFAKALSGGDTSKANEMIEAVKKGFKQATKAWGDKLPDICQKTLDAAVEKLEKWRDGTTQNSDMSGEAAKTFKGQAAASKVAE